MKASRRVFLSGAGAAAASLLAGSAGAQNFLNDFINARRRSGWDDNFDAHASPAGGVAANLPVLRPHTVSFTALAIQAYQMIAAHGRWPAVHARKRLRLGPVH